MRTRPGPRTNQPRAHLKPSLKKRRRPRPKRMGRRVKRRKKKRRSPRPIARRRRLERRPRASPKQPKRRRSRQRRVHARAVAWLESVALLKRPRKRKRLQRKRRPARSDLVLITILACLQKSGLSSCAYVFPVFLARFRMLLNGLRFDDLKVGADNTLAVG